MNHTAANNRNAVLPRPAPSSLPGPSSYRERSKAGEDLVLPTSPQEQQRLRITSGPTSPDSSNQNSYINNDDETAVRTSCAISAVTTPRAAWAEEGDSILDDVAFGGSSKADDHSSDGEGSHGFRDGPKLRPGEDGVVIGSSMATATTADMMSNLCHHEVRCADELGLPRCVDASVVRQQRRAAFGKPSTKVCRPPRMPRLRLKK